MEQDAFTEEQGTPLGDPFLDLDDKCVVDDASHRTRAVAAVMTAATGSGDADDGLDGSSRPWFDKGFARLISEYF
jgi:hypothetical protein